jgi:integrase
MNLRKFITKFRRDIASGARLTERNTVYAKGTVYAISQACERLRKYERHIHHILDFDEIDLKFYSDYTAYLNSQGYSINTTGKCIKVLKQIMALSEAEGYHHNSKYKDKRFKGTRIDVDSIYLTREELDRIDAVDLSGMPEDFAIARDIFMVGVWTAQRISDYNNIHRDEIQSVPMRQIIEDPDPEHPGKTITKVLDKEVKVINITQQKTGNLAVVDIDKFAVDPGTVYDILERYDYKAPYPAGIGNYNYALHALMRDIGFTESVRLEERVAGKLVVSNTPKWKLITSHTARRTFTTVNVMRGYNIHAIKKATGHTDLRSLDKYVCDD